MIRHTIQKTIQCTIRNTLGDTACDLLDLFSGGRAGVWFDPSDLTTLYQESEGKRLVTAVGEPIGLILDRSRGAVLGEELITNGTFDTDLTGLGSLLGSTLAYVDGEAEITTTSPFAGLYTAPVDLEIGKMYVITADVRVGTGFNMQVALIDTGLVGVLLQGGLVSSVSTVQEVLVFTATVSSARVYIQCSGLPGTYYVDSISLKEVLGIPAKQPGSTKRPTYTNNPDRLALDLVDDSLTFEVPTGGWDGYMVVGTDDGTASYGVSLPEGDYDIGGNYFMGGSVSGFIVLEGDVSASDLRSIETDFVRKGAKKSYGDVTNFRDYWREKHITKFPLIDTSSGIDFTNAWLNNSNLTDFPENMFDNCNATVFTNAFTNTKLSQSSIDGILVSIESNGTFNGTFNQTGGSAPSLIGQVAISALRLRGWIVNVTGGY